jgi:adenosylcobinamide-GDP ribazoletransferase
MDRSSPVTGLRGRVDPAGEVFAALRLLTRFRFGADPMAGATDAGLGNGLATEATEATEATGAVAFPLVGALVGAIGAVPLWLLGSLDPVIAALLALAAIALATGALHLDGLADTADALIAPDALRAERARKDPSVGVGGAVALILVIGLEASALAALVIATGGGMAGLALVVAAVNGRTIAVVALSTERPRVARDGFGAWFAARVGPAAAIGAVVITVAIDGAIATLATSPAIAVGGLLGAALGLSLARGIATWRHQLDGDGMGAIVELTVVATLLATALASAALAP